ncbi:hypothetical protein CLOM_g15149 [Closterium sp. NIES-68]|nr:hypothetical protein CLOM_g15149 [Closterium sp. NIES-68]GJP58997.1 hypothetical protein CLOP_g6753 [Closterium sp. NIES-67]
MLVRGELRDPCDVNPSAATCSRYKMIAFAMGPLPNRLQTLCLANATAAISRLSLRVVWLKDEGMIYVPPTGESGGGGGAGGGGRGGWGGGPVVIDTGGLLSPVSATRAFLAHPFVPKTMKFGQCGRSSAALDPSEAERLSLDVWVAVRALNRTKFEKVVGCLVLEEFHRCYARLQPSLAVRSIVESTSLNMTHVKQSTAVYIDAPSDQSSCTGCPPDRKISDCAARSIAMEILGRPSIELTIASRNPSHPTTVAEFFDPNRAPFMPPSAEFRAARCTDAAIQKLMATPGLMDAEPASAAEPGGPKREGRHALEVPTGGAEGGSGGGRGGERGGGGGGAKGGKGEGREGYANVSVEELIEAIEEGRARMVDAGEVARARRVLIACQQHEVS